MTRNHQPNHLAALLSTALFAALAVTLTSQTSAQGSFLDLGTVDPPGSPVVDNSQASDISDDGRTVVGSSSYGDTYDLRAVQFRWHATTGLSNLGTAHGADFASASGVTPDGTVVLGRLSYSVAQSTETSLWESSTGLQRLDSTGALIETHYVDQAGDGDRIFLLSSFGSALHFTRSTGATVTMQPPAGLDRFSTWACDDAGTLAVGAAENFNNGTMDAAIWREGVGTSILPSTGLGQYSTARVVSPDGNLVVGEAWPNANGDKTVWLRDMAIGTTTIIGTTPMNNAASDISNAGDIILYVNGDVWTPATGQTTFETLLAAAGATPPIGSSAIRPSAVSPNGQSFAGRFTTSTTQVHAFVAYLTEPLAQTIGDPVCPSVVPNSTGAPGHLEARGSVLVEDNDVHLVASDLPSNATTLFLNSPTAGFSTNPGGSQGNLCLGGEIGRYAMGITTSTPGGVAELTLDVLQTPRPTALVAIAGGETWRFQAWHRDANPSATSNFTQAVAVTFQ